MATKYEGHPQYVPIIKWQMWEQRALKELLAPVAARTLPCIEARLPAQHATMLSSFANVWKHAALIDYSDPEGKLTATRLNELIQFLKLVGGSGLLSIPVLNPTTAAADFPLISPHLGNRNVALRLRLSNIEHVPYGIAIVQAALAVPGLAAKANRLIVDLGPTPAYGATEKSALAGMLLALKGLGFAHIHLASGAFPMSLAHINGAGEVKRKDWDLWASVEALAPAALVGFSDYGPLSPNWSEETLTRRGSRVTIRYALDDKWRIVRGQYATKAESNAISSIFLTSYPAEFQGKPFSFGDRLIADRVDPTVAAKDKTGGHYHITEFWTHHISYVLQKQY
ncbi:hypothetical protein QMZ25_06835 [Stenotrophomonas sp. RS-48]|uniref:beta family protein n=1 Tax=Stenotrophomonas sp. RS-48 TaxID=3043300 RepID=UPI0024B4D572|nr:hypothetical protein [Stenotrophomonas sp. RS-48]MDI9248298.1 hypothetical protein [Stenotrophomonas sp. RS-48]